MREFSINDEGAEQAAERCAASMLLFISLFVLFIRSVAAVAPFRTRKSVCCRASHSRTVVVVVVV